MSAHDPQAVREAVARLRRPYHYVSNDQVIVLAADLSLVLDALNLTTKQSPDVEKITDADVARCATPGCTCEFCRTLRRHRHPRHVMCDQRWAALPDKEKEIISESCSD